MGGFGGRLSLFLYTWVFYMDRFFDFCAVEFCWLERWCELGLGVADVYSEKLIFVIFLPPSNIIGVLYMGYVVMGSV